MELIKAKEKELDKIVEFYNYVIDNTENINALCHWQKNAYPTREIINNHLKKGNMYYLEDEGVILGAMAIQNRQDKPYTAGKWSQNLTDKEIVVVHLLAVNPELRGFGIGSVLMGYAIDEARERGAVAIRLDAVSTNTPAIKLYESLYFKNAGTIKMTANSYGECEFRLFEYML